MFIEVNDVKLPYLLANRPMPAPERVYDSYTVPGRNGALYVDRETYKDVTVNCTLKYSALNGKAEEFGAAKATIYDAKKLMLSVDPEHFYKVKAVKVGDATPSGSFEVAFNAAFTCDPFRYLESGTEPLTPGDIVENPGVKAEPVYEITGEGMCTLSVNHKEVTINVSGTTTVDVPRRLVCKGDSWTPQAMVGRFEDLELLPGENTVEVTNGFTVSLIPNWREL